MLFSVVNNPRTTDGVTPCYVCLKRRGMGEIQEMTFRFDDPGVMRRLLSDLEQLEAGTLDTSDIRAKAPMLDDYRLIIGWSHAMKGIVTGHPLLPDGHEIVTSQLMYLDPAVGLARTLSRWYRVGKPWQRQVN